MGNVIQNEVSNPVKDPSGGDQREPQRLDCDRAPSLRTAPDARRWSMLGHLGLIFL